MLKMDQDLCGLYVASAIAQTRLRSEQAENREEDMTYRKLVHRLIHRWQCFDESKSLNVLKEEVKKTCVVTNQSETTYEFRFCLPTN